MMNAMQTELRIQASTSLQEVRSQGWDELVGEFDLYLSTPWLRVEENIASLPPIYLTAKIGDRLSAGLTCYALGPDTPAWPFARIDAFIARLFRESGRECEAVSSRLSRTLPTLLCGGRRPGHTRLLLAPELDEDARRMLARHLLCEAERLARQRDAASLSFLYVDEDDHVLRQALSEAGFAEFPSAIAARMQVPTDLDQFLGQFSGHRRRRIQKERRVLQEAGVEYRALPLTKEVIKEILPLELALYAKYATEFPPVEAARLHHAVAEVMGDRVQVLASLQNGKICGFVVLVRWGDTLFGRQGGFDYASQGRLPLYFGLAFYASVEYAIKVGARYIEYGIGSEGAKASRGCDLRQQYGYVKVFNSRDHAAVRRLLEELPCGKVAVREQGKEE